MENVKAVVALGETTDRFSKFAASCGIADIVQAEDDGEAVQKAYPCTFEGDVILLSPACASWDQYPSFEARGDEFIEAVMKLK